MSKGRLKKYYTGWMQSIPVIEDLKHTFKLRVCFTVMGILAIGGIIRAEEANHYIIAFDQSIGKYRLDYGSKGLLSTLERTLEENGFNKEKDYLSMVAYTMELGNPSAERFVRPYIRERCPVIWHKLEDKSLRDLFPNWPLGQPLLNPEEAPYASMQSLAKPYIVMATREKADSMAVAGRTYLLLISDEIVNGTDDNYAQEWNNVSLSLGANLQKFRSLSKGVFETIRAFNEEFKFLQIKFKKGDRVYEKIPISSDGMYKIIPYEVVSVERPSIHAITDIPSPLPLQRIKGGFRLNVDAHSISPKYTIADIKIFDAKEELLGSSNSGNFDLTLPSEKISVGDSLTLALSVELKDGLYNGTILTPDNPRYHDGMSEKQAVKLQDEAKVLGILPLSDMFWWWFPNDIFTAVMIWDLVILVILIIIIGIVLYRCFVKINTYHPANDKLKITKI